MGEGLHQPWSMQIELTEGCTRLCPFCGLNALRSKPGGYRYMTMDMAALVAVNVVALCPGARLEFAMHGEPTMNPQYLDIFRLFRSLLPKTQMQVTTNGARFRGGRMQHVVEGIFDAGVDFVVLDTYKPERDELRAAARSLVDVQVLDFYNDKGVRIYENRGRRFKRSVVLVDDLEDMTGVLPQRVMMNHTGSNPMGKVLTTPLVKQCTTPFRELSVCYDGSVSVCCMDWTRRFVCGVLSESRSLAEIWWGPEFTAARTMLNNKRRDFGCCRYCDAGSGQRVGLLPKLPPVDSRVLEVVKRVEHEGVERAYGRVK